MFEKVDNLYLVPSRLNELNNVSAVPTTVAGKRWVPEVSTPAVPVSIQLLASHRAEERQERVRDSQLQPQAWHNDRMGQQLGKGNQLQAQQR